VQQAVSFTFPDEDGKMQVLLLEWVDLSPPTSMLCTYSGKSINGKGLFCASPVRETILLGVVWREFSNPPRFELQAATDITTDAAVWN